MIRQIAIRVGIGIATLFAVSALVFLGLDALPGDAAQAELGQEATPSLLKQYRKEFGLDRPAPTRYVDWLWGTVHGNLGKSLPTGTSVTKLLRDKVRNSIALALATVVILVPAALFLGIV